MKTKIIFAPMEGVTGYIYRNAHKKFFGGIDRYCSPFIPARAEGALPPKYTKDILPENNQDLEMLPQLLTKDPSQFIHSAKLIHEKYGYSQVDLNLGCPSSTVVSRGRGAGMLDDIDALDRFFDEVFKADGLPLISIKTRIGISFVSEAEDLLKVYNRYPLAEVAVHPRLKDEGYMGNVHLDVFDMFYNDCKHPLIYNGDIRTVSDFENISKKYPDLKGIMIGRGLLADPALAEKICGINDNTDELQKLETFLSYVYDSYFEVFKSEKNSLFKMKELWANLSTRFEDDKYKKSLSQIKKSKNIAEYRAACTMFFNI